LIVALLILIDALQQLPRRDPEPFRGDAAIQISVNDCLYALEPI
jgi:hypothetical protein